jgi:hypothetical protein
MEAFQTIHKHPAERLKQLVLLKTSGYARDFAQDIPIATWRDFEDVKRKLKEEFRPPITVSALAKQIKQFDQEKDESVIVFYRRLLRWLKFYKENTVRPQEVTKDVESKFCDRRGLEMFLGGLRIDILAHMIPQPKILIEAFEMAREVERSNELLASMTPKATDEDPLPPTESATQRMQGTLDRLTQICETIQYQTSGQLSVMQQSNTLQSPMQLTVQSQDPTPLQQPQVLHASVLQSPSQHRLKEETSGARASKWTKGSCKHCRKFGHGVAQCPFKSCGICRQMGHLPYVCPQNQQ